jgi:hypothetical protein
MLIPNPNALVTFVEIVLPQDVTVEALQILGSKQPLRFRRHHSLLAADGTEIYNSGNVEIPLPSGDVTINVPMSRRSPHAFHSDRR